MQDQMEKLLALRAVSAARGGPAYQGVAGLIGTLNLANKEMHAGEIRHECKCGNMLTIEDRGYRCRQCILAGRM